MIIQFSYTMYTSRFPYTPLFNSMQLIWIYYIIGVGDTNNAKLIATIITEATMLKQIKNNNNTNTTHTNVYANYKHKHQTTGHLKRIQ